MSIQKTKNHNRYNNVRLENEAKAMMETMMSENIIKTTVTQSYLSDEYVEVDK